MGEKKNNDVENKKKAYEGEKKKKNKNNEESVTVVLKVDMHCKGCASRIVKCLRGFEGVETVKSEATAGKLTVTGAVDPVKVRQKLQAKINKEVGLISPPPEKDKENAKDNNKIGEDDNKNKAKKSDDKKSDNDKKPKEKEPPVTTAVLKLNFHCQGCIGKIHKIVAKAKAFGNVGVDAISMDKDKQLVTVKGTMDVKKLSETLSEKLRRMVEVVPPANKEKDKENEADSGKKKKGCVGGGVAQANCGGGNKEERANKMEYVATHPGSPVGYEYYQFPVPAHAPQIFSDENPNACAVM